MFAWQFKNIHSLSQKIVFFKPQPKNKQKKAELWNPVEMDTSTEQPCTWSSGNTKEEGLERLLSARSGSLLWDCVP